MCAPPSGAGALRAPRPLRASPDASNGRLNCGGTASGGGGYRRAWPTRAPPVPGDEFGCRRHSTAATSPLRGPSSPPAGRIEHGAGVEGEVGGGALPTTNERPPFANRVCIRGRRRPANPVGWGGRDLARASVDQRRGPWKSERAGNVPPPSAGRGTRFRARLLRPGAIDQPTPPALEPRGRARAGGLRFRALLPLPRRGRRAVPLALEPRGRVRGGGGAFWRASPTAAGSASRPPSPSSHGGELGPEGALLGAPTRAPQLRWSRGSKGMS